MWKSKTKIVTLAACLALFTARPAMADEPDLLQAIRDSVSASRDSVYFQDREWSKFAGPGPGHIDGQAFMLTRGGDVKVGAGRIVYLWPVTAYNLIWFLKEVYAHGKKVDSMDPRAQKYQRTTVGDAEGKFAFDGFPLGDYMVACPIYWETPNPYYRSSVLSETGGIVWQKVTVDSIGMRKLILSTTAGVH